MKTVRVQRKRTLGWKNPPNTKYVGRGTKFGNPFKVGEKFTQPDGSEIILDHQQAVNLYEQSIQFYGSPVSIAEIKALRGFNLSCWCASNQKCHADVLLEIANS